MKPAHFRTDFAAFEEAERAREVRQLTEARQANAEEAWRVGHDVPGYDKVGHWPHLDARHDRLVGPMQIGRVMGLGVGAFFTKLTTEQFITDPTLLVQVTAIFVFFAVSLAAETVFTARWRVPEGFNQARRTVAQLGVAAGMAIVFWLTMRVPNTPLAVLADQGEGVALVAAEVLLLLFAAAAGAAATLFAWSRPYFETEVRLRNRLVELGAETAAIPEVAVEARPSEVLP